MKHVVIVGGGFAGIRTARKLRKNKDVQITVVNESEDFRYCPALYRAATGYKIGTARLPLEWMLLDSNNAELVVAKAEKINPKKHTITLDNKKTLEYDYAVLALGSVTTYFSIDGLHEHSFGIKTAEEIIELREHIHEVATNSKKKEQNYVIVGAGPTGVELAGALGAYLQRIAKKHRTKTDNVTIWLVEAQDRVLPQLNHKASRRAQKRLQKLGVKLQLNTQVKSETIHSLKTSNGTIKTNTVVWTAGTANNPFFQQNSKHFNLSNRGKVEVNMHLQSHRSVYVAGDNAATKYSGTALTAVRHGNFIAKDISARTRNKPRPLGFESPPVSIVPIGPNWAVVSYKSISSSGLHVYWLRKLADYIGYSDVLGYDRALTIWSNTARLESDCMKCAS